MHRDRKNDLTSILAEITILCGCAGRFCDSAWVVRGVKRCGWWLDNVSSTLDRYSTILNHLSTGCGRKTPDTTSAGSDTSSTWWNKKNNAAFECSRLKISLIATSLSVKKSAKLASPYLFIYLYTSLFARKAAATSERSTKHTTTKTNKQKRKNYAQIGRTSEQCYHIYTPTNLFIAGQFLLQWRHCDVDWFVANGDVVSHVKM